MPKEFDKLVKGLKKHKDIDNPYALATWQWKKKHGKNPRKEESGMEKLKKLLESTKLNEKYGCMIGSTKIDYWNPKDKNEVISAQQQDAVNKAAIAFMASLKSIGLESSSKTSQDNWDDGK
jgi:hypothetical protein